MRSDPSASRRQKRPRLRAQLAAMKKDLSAAENAIADALKITPEELLALKGKAYATACINNMKQIGLAAILYARENENVSSRLRLNER